MKIRIIKTPAGEAPEYVRQAWIGLEIPVDPKVQQPSNQAISGVASGEYCGTKLVYSVFALEAFTLLQDRNELIYDMWRANAPQFFTPGKHLLFGADACELIDA